MIYIIYRPDSEHGRQVEEFKKRLDDRRVESELINIDSREGSVKAQNYGIMEYPAVLAVRGSTGQAIQTWSGTVPTISDVEFYARSKT